MYQDSQGQHGVRHIKRRVFLRVATYVKCLLEADLDENRDLTSISCDFLKMLQTVVGIIAQLGCGGKVGGEAVETAQGRRF